MEPQGVDKITKIAEEMMTRPNSLALLDCLAEFLRKLFPIQQFWNLSLNQSRTK